MNAVVCNVCTPDCEMVPLSQSKAVKFPWRLAWGIGLQSIGYLLVFGWYAQVWAVRAHQD